MFLTVLLGLVRPWAWSGVSGWDVCFEEVLCIWFVCYRLLEAVKEVISLFIPARSLC